jgi:transcriptional regulator with XRE-family HTH domain
MSGHRSFSALRQQVETRSGARERIEMEKHAMRDALRLADLRNHQGITQSQLAEAMGVSQVHVSQVEHKEDIYLSTLRRYVAGLGGKLEINAVFGNEKITLTPTIENIDR